MTSPAPSPVDAVVLVVDPDPERGAEVVDEAAGAGLHAEAVTPAVAVARVRERCAEGATVALVVLADEPAGREILAPLHDACPPAMRVLLVTERHEVPDLSAAVTAGHLHGIVGRPWTPGEFGRHLRAQVARGSGAAPPPSPDRDVGGRAEMLSSLELPDGVTAHRLVAVLDEVLGERPRLALADGTVLVREDDEVNGVWVILDGGVALSRRTDHGDELLHRDTTGSVVGLLSFTQQRRAFFTARTVGRVRAVLLTLEQLDQAIRHDPRVSTLFTTIVLRGLAGRLRHSESLQLEVKELNRALAAERDRLAEAMARLEAAELQLVESARMATLGELAAGIAHELNNPAGALQRAASHVLDDLVALLAPEERRIVEAGRGAPPAASAQLRRARRALQDRLGDPELAARLVRAGVTDPDEAARVAAGDAHALARRERLHQLGTALRNIGTASERIAQLVTALRSYARGDERTPVAAVDVAAGIDDTLAMLGHRLEGIEVERRIAEGIPPVRGRPGELNQVWTNLVVNAADALGDRGRIEIAVDRPDPDHVRVRITDDGPGIPAEDLERIFEPRFTTKAGRVAYGLGLGLSIASRIVDEHGGTITMASQPGRTTATVTLPTASERDMRGALVVLRNESAASEREPS